jgi:hypothetical protein
VSVEATELDSVRLPGTDTAIELDRVVPASGNVHASELWRRTTIAAARLLDRFARDHGHVSPVVNPTTGRTRWPKTPARISFGKCAEFQKRGLVHFHILARFDGIDPDDPDDVGDGFTGKVLPERAATARFAFAIPTAELGDVTMQIALDFELDDAIFAGAAK